MARSKVGYGKPPAEMRYRKGVSGNPRGRPKGSRGLATVLDEILREPFVIVENGEKRTVTKLEGAIHCLVKNATSGDTHAIRVLSALIASAEDSLTPDASELAKEDQKVLASLMRQFSRSAQP